MNNTSQGILFMIISTLLYGLFNPLLKKAGLNPYATLIVQLGFSWLLALPLFFATGSYRSISVSSVVLLSIAGGIGSVAYLFAVKAFPILPMWQISLFGVLLPVVTAVASFFILGESFSPKFFAGLAIMCVGLFVALR